MHKPKIVEAVINGLERALLEYQIRTYPDQTELHKNSAAEIDSVASRYSRIQRAAFNLGFNIMTGIWVKYTNYIPNRQASK